MYFNTQSNELSLPRIRFESGSTNHFPSPVTLCSGGYPASRDVTKVVCYVVVSYQPSETYGGLTVSVLVAWIGAMRAKKLYQVATPLRVENSNEKRSVAKSVFRINGCASFKKALSSLYCKLLCCEVQGRETLLVFNIWWRSFRHQTRYGLRVIVEGGVVEG